MNIYIYMKQAKLQNSKCNNKLPTTTPPEKLKFLPTGEKRRNKSYHIETIKTTKKRNKKLHFYIAIKKKQCSS